MVDGGAFDSDEAACGVAGGLGSAGGGLGEHEVAEGDEAVGINVEGAVVGGDGVVKETGVSLGVGEAAEGTGVGEIVGGDDEIGNAAGGIGSENAADEEGFTVEGEAADGAFDLGLGEGGFAVFESGKGLTFSDGVGAEKGGEEDWDDDGGDGGSEAEDLG